MYCLETNACLICEKLFDCRTPANFIKSSHEALLGRLVLFASKSPKAAQWKAADAALTDNLNEAKDNVKYLSTLDKYTEVLYSGTPPQVIDMLPGLLNNIKMMIVLVMMLF